MPELNPHKPNDWTLFIGTKQLLAIPMKRKAYLELQGWPLPPNENPEDDGYAVQYLDGGKPNHPDFDNYLSWSPKDVFREAYKPNVFLGFDAALYALKQGHKVSRIGWNASGQWLSVSNLNTAEVPADRFWSPHNRAYAEQKGGTATVMPCITIKNAQGQIQMGWIPSQGDLFADDWVILE